MGFGVTDAMWLGTLVPALLAELPMARQGCVTIVPFRTHHGSDAGGDIGQEREDLEQEEEEE